MLNVQLVILIFLLALSTIVAYINIEHRIGFRFKFLTLVLLSGLLTFYIRTGFGRYFTTIDESYYVSLLGNPSWYTTSIVSGYLTPLSLHLVYSRTFNVINTILGYSIVMSVIYVIVLFLAYRQSGISENHALLSILVLFFTPLYLWAVIQIRPQQIGMLVGIILTIFIVRGRPTSKFFVAVLMLCLTLIFAHMLSFILYSVVLVTYLALSTILEKQSSDSTKKKYMAVAISIMMSWVVFILFPYSANLLNNMVWITNSTLHTQMSARTFYVVSTLAFGISLSVIYLGAKYLNSRINQDSIRAFIDLIDTKMNTSYGRYLPWILSIVIIFILAYTQFRLGSKVYTRVYNNSTLALAFFQIGNLFFALFFLRGILLKIKENTITRFDILPILWIFIGVALLFLSFFMPAGSKIWGFHNWLIRALQYLVVFASPVVAYPIVRDIQSGNSMGMKLTLSLLLGVLIIISALNGVRVPGVYSYDTVWTRELVNICQNNPSPAIYIPRTDGSATHMFSTSNLINACGGSLKRVDTKALTYLMLSSDHFYLYAPDYRPISLGSFESTLQSGGVVPRLIMGGNSKLWGYYLQFFKMGVPIPIGKNDNCPLGEDTTLSPAILIGGRAVNKCTSKLEKEQAVPVYLDSHSVRTPTEFYSIPSADPWWNSTEGLFVIQAVEYYGTPILIIEGTNADATFAAIQYFVEEILPNMSSKYKKAKYIIGKWEERDGRVIEALKFSPKDSDGFSQGDEIKIIEIGE
jgi:hypothetical protein